MSTTLPARLPPVVNAKQGTSTKPGSSRSERPRRTFPGRMDQLGDAELLAAWADTRQSATSRQDAFRELLARHGDRVFAICIRELGCRDDAQEATQDTFAKAARASHNFRGESEVTTWLYRIAINTCRDLQRRHARRPVIPVGDVQSLANATSTEQRDAVGEAALANDLADAVRHALDRLDPSTRTLVVLCAIEGVPYAEAAKAFDLPVGTIKSRIFRSRAKIAQGLRRQARAPGHRPSRSL